MVGDVFYTMLLSKNIKVISEVEFAFQFTHSEIIAITGSNGKTTTTLLTHKILNDYKLNVAIGGNTGTRFSSLITDKDYSYLVLELSSFQLEGIQKFKPHIAVITNLSPDHLDRYIDYDDYIKSKFRITMNQSSNDYLIYDGEILKSGSSKELAEDSVVRDKYLGKNFKLENNE